MACHLSQMKITVLLPVYNAGAPLKASIESILHQDFSDFEFLIIDDASKDGSTEIIREYSKIDSRICPVFHSTNMGLAGTLNEGIQLARCDLVARMDQDDEALPHRLEIQHRFMTSRPDIAVAGSFFYYMGKDHSRDRIIRYPDSREAVEAALTSYNCICHPTVILRRNQILELGGYRTEFKNAEDYDLWLRVVKQYGIVNIPVALLRYRFSVTGMTLSRKWEQLYYVFLALACYENPVQTFSYYEQVAKEKLSAIHKADFLEHVATCTAKELFQLGFIKDARRLLYHFSGDIGWKRAWKIGWNLYSRRNEPDRFKQNIWIQSV